MQCGRGSRRGGPPSRLPAVAARRDRKDVDGRRIPRARSIGAGASREAPAPGRVPDGGATVVLPGVGRAPGRAEAVGSGRGRAAVRDGEAAERARITVGAAPGPSRPGRPRCSGHGGARDRLRGEPEPGAVRAGSRASRRRQRRFWDEAAQANAMWYVDTSLSYEHPDPEMYEANGKRIATS